MMCKKLKNNIILLLVIIYTFSTCSQICKASLSTEQIDFVKSKLEMRGYYISKVIGKGKYGIAFLGRTPSSELVCFKCVFSKSFSNLEYEIFKIDEINTCPNITKILEEFEIEVKPIPIILIASEFNEGGTLLERYKFFNERPSKKDALQIIRDVSNALQVIHKNGFIHRDIKSDNIMISHGRYKLIDFGLTIVIDSPKTKEGFAPYKSPEFLLFSIDGCNDYNEKVDIWALGIMMYHLITGKLPYVQRDSDKKLLPTKELWENSKAFCVSLNDASPFAPEPINSLIVSCFIFNPDDRISAEFLYNSSCELLKDFEEK